MRLAGSRTYTVREDHYADELLPNRHQIPALPWIARSRNEEPIREVPLSGISTKSRWLLAAIAGLELAAAICQFAQHTDPRFPLIYFTVWSGILAGLVAAAQLRQREYRALPAARSAAAVGVIVSAVIFALVIAPATYTGTWFQPWDDVYVRIANTIFHGAAPVLVFADFVLRPPSGRFRDWLAAAYCWPLTYLISLVLVSAILDVQLPYPFLDPHKVSWNSIALAICGVIAMITVATAALFVSARIFQKLTLCDW